MNNIIITFINIITSSCLKLSAEDLNICPRIKSPAEDLLPRPSFLEGDLYLSSSASLNRIERRNTRVFDFESFFLGSWNQ